MKLLTLLQSVCYNLIKKEGVFMKLNKKIIVGICSVFILLIGAMNFYNYYHGNNSVNSIFYSSGDGSYTTVLYNPTHYKALTFSIMEQYDPESELQVSYTTNNPIFYLYDSTNFNLFDLNQNNRIEEFKVNISQNEDDLVIVIFDKNNEIVYEQALEILSDINGNIRTANDINLNYNDVQASPLTHVPVGTTTLLLGECKNTNSLLYILFTLK